MEGPHRGTTLVAVAAVALAVAALVQLPPARPAAARQEDGGDAMIAAVR